MSDYKRLCSRTMCQREATSTLTYAYADSTAVVGPLATRVEPHAYDLCEFHAQRLTAPRGWEVVHLDAGAPSASWDEGDARGDADLQAAGFGEVDSSERTNDTAAGLEEHEAEARDDGGAGVRSDQAGIAGFRRRRLRGLPPLT